MVQIRLAYTVSDTDRKGRIRHYFRYRGKKIRLPGQPGSETFMDAYQAALAEHLGVSAGKHSASGSLRRLCEEYYGSRNWKSLDDITRRRRRSLLDRLCERHGEKPVRLMERRHVIKIMDDLCDTPHGANNLLKAMRGLFKWALAAERIDRNVVRDVAKAKTPAGGWHTWTVEEVQQYEERHLIGTKARLALALVMFSGVRRSDVVRLGKQHRTKDGLAFTVKKDERNKPVRLTLPILPSLDRIIAATPSKGLTFLETAYGKPWSNAGFGNKFREWCDEAGLPQCSAHGLRKAAATIAAENGATAHQLMAIFGWKTLQQAEVYTRAADQKRLARTAMHMLIPVSERRDEEDDTKKTA